MMRLVTLARYTKTAQLRNLSTLTRKRDPIHP